MKKIKKQYRQGDILIEEVETLPIVLKQKEDLVIVRGEVTGHSHKLTGGVIWIEESSGEMYLDLSSPQKLIHEEHEAIEIPEGKYKVIRQREYDEKEIRFIED
jgi:hypothetical protein